MPARSASPPEPDPFATSALRRVVLDAWAASPARFREDANAEEALATGGYADRLLVELAANGVDAALEAQLPGRVRFTLDTEGPVPELRVANVGAPLTAAGVSGLASLRASAKRRRVGEEHESRSSVGHFGVGFTAVLTVTDAPSVVSTTGSVRFSAGDTTAAVAALGVAALDAEVGARGGQVPVLRLPWSDAATDVPAGFDTQVRLPLRDGLLPTVRRLLADMADELLWALPGLAVLEVELPGMPVRTISRQNLPGDRTVITDDGVSVGYRSVVRRGTVPADLLTGRPVEERGRTNWQVTWALPDPDDHTKPTPSFAAPPAPERLFLGAPTPTDEPLSLPARLVGSFPVDDTRRRLAPGPLTTYLLAIAADAYCELFATVPVDRRLALVPAAGFPAGPVDAQLRADILRRLSEAPVLRSADGSAVRPGAGCVVTGISDAAAVLLVRAVPGLLPPPSTLADLAALRVLGVTVLPLAEATSALAGIDGPPRFWRRVYEALADQQTEDVATVPVPLSGGGRRIGPLGCLLPGPDALDDALLERAARVADGLKIVHPEAAHPLLARCGAVPADTAALLGDPALIDTFRHFREDLEDADPDPDELRELAALALDLAATLGPAEGSAPPEGLLADVVLTNADGEAWPAGDLLAPGAPLASVLADDADLPVIGAEWLRYPERVLSAVGVRTGLTVLRVSDEDADLPDLADWWSEVVGDGPPPEPFDAVADLDLIDEQQWPRLLDLLGADRKALQALSSGPDPSYTRWWLSRFARIGGAPPSSWRLPEAVLLTGLYDVLPAGIDPVLARSIGALGDGADALRADPAGLVARLSDPSRSVPAGAVPLLTALAVEALEAHPDLALPGTVRTVSGAVIDADAAAVIDQPWLAQVLDPSMTVAGGPDPYRVARVLDLQLASERWSTRLVVPDAGVGGGVDIGADVGDGDGVGEPAPLERAVAERAALSLGVAVPGIALRVVAELRVRVEGGQGRQVTWWPMAGSGAPGAAFVTDGTADGVGRVVAWAAGRWADRDRAVAAARGGALNDIENGIANGIENIGNGIANGIQNGIANGIVNGTRSDTGYRIG